MGDQSSVKAKALEDARLTQAAVTEAATKAGKAPPKYALDELIGKGSYGRVYKGKDTTTAGIVAVKIIDVDRSDIVSPRNADSFSEFLKEISALKILSENRARNINHIIDGLLIGHTVWIITEYCGGGSVATLMKPTPKGLQEKWIIPILREVAEALKWVHQAGIVHRDVKCANVLVTEQGSVQLCDFGVAGIMESKGGKRSTFVGTVHWMAPEFFDPTLSYGKEVDVWALGSMAYEIATGLPPNAARGISSENLGSYLKEHVPRLESEDYSRDLRSFVAYCLEMLPGSRPTIEQVQRHSYIQNTRQNYPAASLLHLVRAFQMWEYHGGRRKSLFTLGGAKGLSDIEHSEGDNEWNFSTTAAFDQENSGNSAVQDAYDAYSTDAKLEDTLSREKTSLSQPQYPKRFRRRRPPPKALARIRAPLEKLFDPNTTVNYEEDSRVYYGGLNSSDLPLRDNSTPTSIRDTVIDLGSGWTSEVDLNTIKAGLQSKGGTGSSGSSPFDFRKPPLSDPFELRSNRRTQEWKFPPMEPPASAAPDVSIFPESYLAVKNTSKERPDLIPRPKGPIDSKLGSGRFVSQHARNRSSAAFSLIDLDMSLPDFVPELSRPSTANSDAPSQASEKQISNNAFELEHDITQYKPLLSGKQPVGDPNFLVWNSEAETIVSLNEAKNDRKSPLSDMESTMAPPPRGPLLRQPVGRSKQYTAARLPDLVEPPSSRVIAGVASNSEMSSEMLRMIHGMVDQLEAFRDIYKSL